MSLIYLLASTDQASNYSGNSFVQLIYIFFIFVIIIIGAYYTSRVLGKYQGNKIKNGNLKIIEAVSVGPQKSLQLVKIGDEFILIGVTKDRITFMKEVSGEHIDVTLLESNVSNTVPFSQYLDKLMHIKKINKNDKK